MLVDPGENEAMTSAVNGCQVTPTHFRRHEVPHQNGAGEDCVDAGPVPQPRSFFPTSTRNPKPSRRSGAVVEKPLDESYTYNMRHAKRGHFVVFNHKSFSGGSSPRPGTEKDEVQIDEAARRLGFETVDVFHDLSKAEIFNVLEKYANDDHTHHDCFACAILTHGEENDVLWAKDRKYELKDITRLFGADICPTLAGKPKMFFIQACRGSKFDNGARLYDVVDSALTDHTESCNPLTIPVESDFLIAHSTAPDYYSWRNRANGSIYMQVLSQCFHEFGSHLEIMQILTRVNRRVARQYESHTKDKSMNGKKQIPSVTTRLTAEVYFTDKYQKLTTV